MSDITDLATNNTGNNTDNTALNAKTDEVKNEIPTIVCKIYLESTWFYWKSWFEVKV